MRNEGKGTGVDVEVLLRTRAWEVQESPVDLGYRPVKGWPELPSGWRLGQVAGVTADSKGRYYVYHRGSEAPSLLCFNRGGQLLNSWGGGAFVRPHAARCDRNDDIWLVDDQAHVLYLYSPEGRLLKTLGTKGIPGQDGEHFNQPTDLAFSPKGDLYVSDGYGNRRIAHFDRDLRFLGQWGSEGRAEGQFLLPHSVAVDREGLVYGADRADFWRVEVFTPQGEFLYQWTHIGMPWSLVFGPDGYLYVCDGENARITKVDRSGKVVGFFGGKGAGLGQLSMAHSIAIAGNGDLLVAHLDGRAQLFTLE